MQTFIQSLTWTCTPLILLCSGLKSKSNFWRKQLLRSLVLKQSNQLFAWWNKESLNEKGISEKENQILEKNIFPLKKKQNVWKVNTIAKKNVRNGCKKNCSVDCSENFTFDVRKKYLIVTGVYQTKQKSNQTMCLL